MTRGAVALSFCRALTGFEDLSERFAAEGLRRLAGEYTDAAVDALLAAFEAGGITAVTGEPVTQPMLSKLLLFFYTGFGNVADDGAAVPENHFESLMWRAIDAHPPGLSGGYFGHWFYPPEDRDDARAARA